MNLEYQAPDGTWHESPEVYLFTDILGGCGCGLSDEVADKALELLKYFGTPHSERESGSLFSDDSDLSYEILAHWLDSKGLIEHGSSVYSSWLTKSGEEVLQIINNG